MVVDADGAELVDQHGAVGERRVAQQPVEQARFSRPEKARQHVDRQPAVHQPPPPISGSSGNPAPTGGRFTPPPPPRPLHPPPPARGRPPPPSPRGTTPTPAEPIERQPHLGQRWHQFLPAGGAGNQVRAALPVADLHVAGARNAVEHPDHACPLSPRGGGHGQPQPSLRAAPMRRLVQNAAYTAHTGGPLL